MIDKVTPFVFVVFRVVLVERGSGIIGNSFYQFQSPPSFQEIIGAIEETIKKEAQIDPHEIVIMNFRFLSEEAYNQLVGMKP